MKKHPGYKPGRIIALAVMALAGAPAIAEEQSGRIDLKTTIGEPAAAVIQLLGPATLESPAMLWYSQESAPMNNRPALPAPGILSGSNGLVVDGAGGEVAPWSPSRQACELAFVLGTNGTVESVEQSGPGCFEMIHELARKQAENRE